MAEILFAEYPDPQGLARAIAALREAGHVKLDAFSPYGDEEVRKALGRPRSRLPVAICLVGLVAAGFTYFLQWFLVAYLYPLDVGGRPAHMPLPFFIITFEMGVLAAAFSAFFGVLAKARLLRLYDPVFEVDGIERTSVDRHWLRVEPEDAAKEVREALEATSPLRIVVHPGRST